MRRSLLLLLLPLPLVLGALSLGHEAIRSRPAAAATPVLPFYSSADFTAEWIAPDSARYAAIHRIAPFALRNQLGQVITNDTLKGRIYVANFFFSTCHGICPKMMANLRRVQTAYRDDPDVLLVSHSVMPAADSQEVLRLYAEENGIEAGKWHLLTGERDTIFALARGSYFAEKELGVARRPDEFLHTENMLLIDRHGRIRGIYNATLPLDAERLIEEVRFLKGEP